MTLVVPTKPLIRNDRALAPASLGISDPIALATDPARVAGERVAPGAKPGDHAPTQPCSPLQGAQDRASVLKGHGFSRAVQSARMAPGFSRRGMVLRTRTFPA